MAATPTKLITFAEFEQLPEFANGNFYELRHGELAQVAPPKLRHTLIQRKIMHLLEQAAGTAGSACTELGFRAVPEHEYRTADVAYASKDRWAQQDPDGYFQGAPDLVIEVLSPSNTASEMLDKKILCLENGSREFWQVDVTRKQVEVSSAEGRSHVFKSGQAIPLYFAPGQSLSVDDLFD